MSFFGGLNEQKEEKAKGKKARLARGGYIVRVNRLIVGTSREGVDMHIVEGTVVDVKQTLGGETPDPVGHTFGNFGWLERDRVNNLTFKGQKAMERAANLYSVLLDEPLANITEEALNTMVDEGAIGVRGKDGSVKGGETFAGMLVYCVNDRLPPKGDYEKGLLVERYYPVSEEEAAKYA